MLNWFKKLFNKEKTKQNTVFELIRTPYPTTLIEFDGVEYDRYGEQYVQKYFEEDIFIPGPKIQITKDQFKILIRGVAEEIKNEQSQKNR